MRKDGYWLDEESDDSIDLEDIEGLFS